MSYLANGIPTIRVEMLGGLQPPRAGASESERLKWIRRLVGVQFIPAGLCAILFLVLGGPTIAQVVLAIAVGLGLLRMMRLTLRIRALGQRQDIATSGKSRPKPPG